MEDNLDIIRQEIDHQMAYFKDKLIDDTLRLTNEFRMNWDRLQQKRMEIEQRKAQQDKLNK
jgi:hypothetical protein